jgi:hypothetical protein
MAEDEQATREGEFFPPTTQNAESREETVRRALRDDPLAARESVERDPSVRRGAEWTIFVRRPIYAVIGAAFGAVLGLVLAIGPGPLNIPLLGNIGDPERGTITTLFGTLGFMVLLAFVFALVFMAISGLLQSAREDGRTERRVEESTGERPGPPADPLDPRHDI